MNVDWICEECGPDEQQAWESLWEEFEPEVEAKLAELPVDPVELRLAVFHLLEADTPETTESWELQAALHLTTQTLVAESRAETPREAMTQLVAELARRIDDYVEQPEEVCRVRQGLEAILPLLQRNHAEGRSYQFIAFLAPLVRSLITHARRELDILELEGKVPPEELAPNDILDETLLQAWKRFDQRPPGVPLDLWLISLIHEVTSGIARGEVQIPLPSAEDVPLPEREDREEAEAEFPFEEDTDPLTEWEQLLPGHPALAAWDEMDVEERRSQTARLLSRLPTEQRHALVLATVEGFTPEQIAAVQDRPVSAVLSDLESARATLSQALDQWAS